MNFVVVSEGLGLDSWNENVFLFLRLLDQLDIQARVVYLSLYLYLHLRKIKVEAGMTYNVSNGLSKFSFTSTSYSQFHSRHFFRLLNKKGLHKVLSHDVMLQVKQLLQFMPKCISKETSI